MFSTREFYDNESNIVDFSGHIVERATAQSIKHKSGHVNNRSREPFNESLAKTIKLLDVSQLLHKSIANILVVRCARLPSNQRPGQCKVKLRDFVAEREGKISLNKLELVAATKKDLFLEKEVPKVYEAQNPNPNGTMYASIRTSSTQSVIGILTELHSKLSRMSGSDEACGIVVVTHRLINCTHHAEAK